jgi:YesN/AraC family two-component response regulator
MPEMDGIELLKKVKAVHPNMLVIMVTVYPEIDLALEAMRLGNQGHYSISLNLK